MIWTVEYSPQQKTFHVDTLDKVLEINRRTVAQGLAPGFVMLHIAETSEDAHAFAERFERECFCGYQPPRDSNHSGEE